MSVPDPGAIAPRPKNCRFSLGGRFCFMSGGTAHELHLRAEGRVQRRGQEGARVQRPGHELPEGIEPAEGRAVGMVVMGGRVVHVGGQPDHVAHLAPRDVREQLGHLELAPQRRPGIAVGDGLKVARRVGNGEAQRHVAGDHLPGGPG